MEKEREHTKFIIQRFDTYIGAANTKGNFLFAFNIFLCGGIITNYKNLIGLIDNNVLIYLNLGLILLFVVGIIATALIVKAVYPFLNSGDSSKDKYHSHIFFGSIAEFDSDKVFTESYQAQDDKLVDEDMVKQAFWLAKGLKAKYASLAWAMRMIYAELILLFIILTLITIY